MDLSLLVFTQHEEVMASFNRLGNDRGYRVSFENGLSKSLLKLLEQDFKIFIIDADIDTPSYLDLIKIVQRIRPNVAIIVLLVSMDFGIVRLLSELNVYFYLVKPVQYDQIEKVFLGIERQRELKQRNQLSFQKTPFPINQEEKNK